MWAGKPEFMGEVMAKVDISKLSNWDKNPRGIKKDDFGRLKSQIKELGLYKPFLVDKSSNIVLGGNMRLRACQELDIKEVPVSYVDAPTDELKIKYALSDNDRAGYYEEDQLAELILSVPDIELSNYKLDLGNLTSVQDLLNRFAPDPEEDEAPEVSDEPPVSKLGEVYQLGRHRVMCGDSTKIEDVEKLMDGKKADMVFTDPPYNTGMGSKNAGSTRLNHMFEDSFTDEQWEDFMSLFMSNYATIMKDDSVAYICLDWRRNHELVPHIKSYFHLSNIIVWDKMVHGLGSDYKYTYELINVCKKGNPELQTHQGDEREYSDVWHIQRKMGKDEDHATKKPIELCERAISHASKRDDVVVDLFLGSGSTLIACEQTNRTCYGMELDPKYVDVIRKRYWKFIDPENWEERWQM